MSKLLWDCVENNVETTFGNYIFAQTNTFSCAKEYITAVINVKMREEEESSMIFIAVQISAFSMFILQECFFAFFLVIGLRNGKWKKKCEKVRTT